MDIRAELLRNFMKIAFDLRRIGNPGIGRYMKCLVEQILKQENGHQYLLILPTGARDPLAWPDTPNISLCFAKSPYYSVREQFEIPQILRHHRVDLLHSPHFLLPLWCPCPAVATIHDVIYIACCQDLPSAIGRRYYRTMIGASARLSARIITDSIFSKSEIVRYLHIDPEKIAVVYPAVAADFERMSDAHALQAVLSRHRIERDYILYTGIGKARKNHGLLLRAFRQFHSGSNAAQLVIAGPLDDGERPLKQLAAELGIEKQVVFTGFIPDSDLRALYSSARVYACPSLYEGFGFTILEAMACGTPVVCSNTSSLPEVAGDAALYADPRDCESFSEALYEAFTNCGLREALIERGYDNVRRFSWEEAANRSLGIFDEALGRTLGQAISCT